MKIFKTIKEKIKKFRKRKEAKKEKKIGDDEGIHVRCIRYGYERDKEGFLWSQIEKYYNTDRPKDWAVVKKFLLNAYDNSTRATNHDTPYILFEQLGNNQPDQCRYNLSYVAYMTYVEYNKLEQAKKDTELAQKTAKKAITISIWTLVVAIITAFFSIYFSYKQIHSSTKFNLENIRHQKTQHFLKYRY